MAMHAAATLKLTTLPLCCYCYVVTGVETSGCGTRTIRLRPMLIFRPDHAQIYCNILENVLADSNSGVRKAADKATAATKQSRS